MISCQYLLNVGGHLNSGKIRSLFLNRLKSNKCIDLYFFGNILCISKYFLVNHGSNIFWRIQQTREQLQ